MRILKRGPHSWASTTIGVLWLSVVWAGCTVDFANKGDEPDAVAPGCGNGILEPGEACDGPDFGGQTCDSVAGYSMGSLACTESCGLELSGCHNCGDGEVDPGETCDDQNGDTGDGCLGCQVETGWTCNDEPSQCSTICGDGLKLGVEACDDGNVESGDGCSSACQGEPGWVCVGEPSVCAETCGNGVQDDGEACDDGNLIYEDGCSPSCAVEAGWSCSGWPSTCEPVCGDGLVLPVEACDDGNTALGDGCRPDCTVEDGWTCDYSQNPPAGCVPICGDGLILGPETCDDGDSWPGDGCSNTCQVEPYHACDGEPSQCTCVVYVDRDTVPEPRTGGSWSAALDKLNDALSAAYSRRPCEIWVAEGTYYTYQSSVSNVVSLWDDSELYGGFAGGETARAQRDFVAHPTVISGEQEGNPGNRVWNVLYASSDWGIVIDGFTITRGNGTAVPGGGFRLTNGSQALVQNVVFTDNEATNGGAIYMESGSTLELLDATFLSNVSNGQGGAVYGDGWNGSLLLDRCLLQGNQAAQDGGALFTDNLDVTIDNSRFVSNQAQGFGGAIRAFGGAEIWLTSASFWANDGGQGGGAVSFYQCGSGSNVVNCTFFDNTTALGEGASIRLYSCDLDVVNSILWGAGTDQVYEYLSNANIESSDVTGGFVGSNNIGSTPLFVDPPGGDLRLAAGSPCIDRADGWAAPTFDLEGNPRVDDPSTPNWGVGNPSYVDMGAYEYQP